MQPWEQYSYRVFWSAEDGEYAGICAELPGLSWLAKKPEAVLRGVRSVAREAVAILQQDGDPVPEPIASRSYSGVFKVCIPPEVHRGLVQEASEQGVSLNRLVTVKLAGGAKPRAAKKPARKSAVKSSRAHLGRV